MTNSRRKIVACFILVIVLVAIYAIAHADIFDSGLIFEYTFDSNSLTGGTNFTNAHGSAGAASGVGSPPFVVAPMGQGLSFNGTTQYAQSNTGISNGNGTISCWMYINATSTVSFAMESLGSLTDRFYILDSGTLGIQVTRGNPASSITVLSGANVVLKRWYFVTNTWTSGVVSGYLNGVFVASSTYTNLGDNSSIVYFGNQEGVSNWFNGRVDDPRYYSRTLSAAEVAQLYNQGLPHNWGDF